MSAPLTIEQMILNHNVGVNVSDASTFKGHQLSDFLMVGAQFNASSITSGTLNTARLPVATSGSAGIVQLSSNVNSTSATVAATSSAVNAVKLEADGKANAVHQHAPGDIQAGTFTNRLSAKSELALNTGIIRNVFISDQPPANTMGSDGDLYFQYQD